MPELVAENSEDYLDIIESLINSPKKLLLLRQTP
jgi:hypothetical protein